MFYLCGPRNWPHIKRPCVKSGQLTHLLLLDCQQQGLWVLPVSKANNAMIFAWLDGTADYWGGFSKVNPLYQLMEWCENGFGSHLNLVYVNWFSNFSERFFITTVFFNWFHISSEIISSFIHYWSLFREVGNMFSLSYFSFQVLYLKTSVYRQSKIKTNILMYMEWYVWYLSI